MTNLYALADSVHDEKGFIDFLYALAADFNAEREIEKITPSNPYGPGALGWENIRVDHVLESAARWGEDSIDGMSAYEKPTNPWRRAANIMLAGKFYE